MSANLAGLPTADAALERISANTLEGSLAKYLPEKDLSMLFSQMLTAYGNSAAEYEKYTKAIKLVSLTHNSTTVASINSLLVEQCSLLMGHVNYHFPDDGFPLQALSDQVGVLVDEYMGRGLVTQIGKGFYFGDLNQVYSHLFSKGFGVTGIVSNHESYGIVSDRSTNFPFEGYQGHRDLIIDSVLSQFFQEQGILTRKCLAMIPLPGMFVYIRNQTILKQAIKEQAIYGQPTNASGLSFVNANWALTNGYIDQLPFASVWAMDVHYRLGSNDFYRINTNQLLARYQQTKNVLAIQPYYDDLHDLAVAYRGANFLVDYKQAAAFIQEYYPLVGKRIRQQLIELLGLNYVHPFFSPDQFTWTGAIVDFEPDRDGNHTPLVKISDPEILQSHLKRVNYCLDRHFELAAPLLKRSGLKLVLPS